MSFKANVQTAYMDQTTPVKSKELLHDESSALFLTKIDEMQDFSQERD